MYKHIFTIIILLAIGLISSISINANTLFDYNLLTVVDSPKRTWINYVDVSDSSIIVNISANNVINDSTFATWINIDSQAYIQIGNNKYRLDKTDGIAISPKYTYYDRANQTLSFILMFSPKTPIKNSSFSLIENDSSEWKFKGINLYSSINGNSTGRFYAPHKLAGFLGAASDSLMRIGKFEEAIEINNEVLHFIEQNNITNADNLKATASYYLAGCYNNLHDEQHTLRYALSVIETYRENHWNENIALARMYGVVADVYARNKDFAKAIEYGEEALRIKKIIYPYGDSDLALTYGKLSSYYEQTGDIEHVVNYVNEYFHSKADNKEHLEAIIFDFCDDYFTRSHDDFIIKDYSAAEQKIAIAIGLWDINCFQHDEEYVKYTLFHALCFGQLNEYKQAIKTALSVWDIMQSSGKEDPNYLAYLNSISQWYLDLHDSNLNDGFNYANEAIAIAESVPNIDSSYHAYAIRNLAQYQRLLGYYGESIKNYQKALDIISPSDSAEIPKILYGLAACYGNINNYPLAIKYGELALAYIDKTDKPNQYAEQLLELSSYYREIKLFDKAIDKGIEAINLYHESNGESIDYARALHAMSMLYYDIGNIEIAETYVLKAYEIRKSLLNENDPEIASSLIDLIQIFLAQKNYIKCKSLSREALSIYAATEGKNSLGYMVSLENLIFALALNKEFEEAKVLLAEYIIILQNSTLQNFKNLSFGNQTTYWKNINASFERMFYVTSCVEYTDDSDMAGYAYNLALLSKGILLASQIKIENSILSRGDKDAISTLNCLKKCRSNYNSTSDIVLRNKLQQRIDSLDIRLIEQLSEDRDFKWPLECSWKDVQKSLKDNEVAVEFFKSHLYYYAAIIKKGWEAPKMIELGKNTIIDEFPLMEGDLFETPKNEEAYDLLLKPIVESIGTSKVIYFSPSGALHQINLECLKSPKGEFISDALTMYRLSSTRQLTANRLSTIPREAVLYGNLSYNVEIQDMLANSQKYSLHEMPNIKFEVNDVDAVYRSGWHGLPETKEEIHDIENILKNYNISCTLFENANGNEESFKNLTFKDKSIIHLATHGFFLKNDTVAKYPITIYETQEIETLNHSGLILSAAQKAWQGDEIPKNIEDGILFASEIATLDLSKTDMVVLSACQTGLGTINNEGVWGLQRAFKLAGVNTIVMSLWKVDDLTTRLLMCEFYRQFMNGLSKQDALKSAQKYIRGYADDNGNKLFEHPYFWAGFIILD